MPNLFSCGISFLPQGDIKENILLFLYDVILIKKRTLKVLLISNAYFRLLYPNFNICSFK